MLYIYIFVNKCSYSYFHTVLTAKQIGPKIIPKSPLKLPLNFALQFFLWGIGFVTYYYSFPSQVCLQQSLSCATACAQAIVFFCCKISDFDTSLSILTRNKSTHGFWISAVQKKVFIFLLGKYIKVVQQNW